MPVTSPNESVLVATDGAVCTVTLNRESALNALNVDMLVALGDVVPAIAADTGIRCLVLQGSGDHFMAGGDIGAFKEWVDQHPDRKELQQMFQGFVTELQPMIAGLRRMPKPVIAAVKGAAAGFGLSLMMACDLAVAAEDSVFTLAYTHIGASPDGSSTYMLPRIVGQKRAFEIALLGERFDAPTAFQAGLVNRLAPADRVEAESLALARRLAEGPAQAVARTKALLNRSLNATLEDQMTAEAEAFGQCAATADFAEGVTAFMEKRAPKFTGS